MSYSLLKLSGKAERIKPKIRFSVKIYRVRSQAVVAKASTEGHVHTKLRSP